MISSMWRVCWAILVLLVLSACKPASQKPANPYLGSWEGALSIGAKLPGVEPKLRKELEAGLSRPQRVQLDLRSDDRFTLTLLGQTLEGAWRLDQDGALMVIEHVGGRSRLETETLLDEAKADPDTRDATLATFDAAYRAKLQPNDELLFEASGNPEDRMRLRRAK